MNKRQMELRLMQMAKNLQTAEQRAQYTEERIQQTVANIRGYIEHIETKTRSEVDTPFVLRNILKYLLAP